MTPEARVTTAAELLDQILTGEAAEKVLTGWARKSRFAGSKDRAAIRDHVFEALRCKRSFASYGGSLTGRGLMIGMLRAEGRDPEAVFTGVGHAGAQLSEAELAGGTPPEGAALLDLPDWLMPALTESLGENLTQVAETMRSRAPVMLRVNLRKADRSEAIDVLTSDNVVAVPAEVSDTALLVTEGPRRVAGSVAYLDGLVELQDGASQAVVDRFPLQDGMRVLDYCAGGGGKTLAMAGRVQAKFSAFDAFPQRLKDLPDRADRAGVRVEILEPDDLEQATPFDLVLCDAPCSGSGAWRRSPEGKWALTAERLAELNAIQDEILDTAQAFVAPDGVLAYATCSVLRAENDARLEAFVQRHPEWTVQWSHHWLPGPEGDGFFAACLTRAQK